MATDTSAILHAAIERDPRVLAARSIHQSKLAEAEGAWSNYLPVLRGIGSAGNSKANDPLTRDGSKRTYGLEIEQPIPIFGREAARVELARVAVRVDEAELKRVEQSVLAELLETLVTLHSAEATLKQREELAANLAQQALAAREAVESGGLKATEERQLLSRKAQAAALQARALADLRAAQAKLRRLLPKPDELASLGKVDLKRWWVGQPQLALIEEKALAASPPLLRAQAEAEQAGAEHAVVRSDFWPKLSVTLQSVKGSFGAASADSQSAFIGVSVPIFEGGATVSRAESSAHRLSAAKDKAQHERDMTRQRVAEAWARWQAAEAMALAWQEAEQQETEGVVLAEEELAGGGSSRFDLLKAKQTLLETRIQGVDYRTQRDTAWIALLREAGVLRLGNGQSAGDAPSSNEWN